MKPVAEESQRPAASRNGLTAGVLPSMPSFDEFYGAVNGGRIPFPWQRRLAAQVRDNGGWPSEIGIQTGLGKTACLDIAIWWLAAEADKNPRDRVAPTRIWWVVNRRLLVDSTHEHAQHIAQRLRDPGGTSDSADSRVLAAVAARLFHVAGTPEGVPLQVSRLRGGVAPARPRHPAQPAVLLSTVPMYGSRLLFRGYGSSRSMRPIDAAHAGTDSLVLVDEAHLATHLMHLIPALAECYPNSTSPLPGQRSLPQIVSLTATGDATVDRFQLDDTDCENGIVRKRLDAPKRLILCEKPRCDVAKQAGHMAAATAELLQPVGRPTSCVVFANTPAVARAARKEIESLKGQGIDAACEVLLLTGRNREHDAQHIRDRLLDPVRGAPAERAETSRDHSLIVVATQTLEVGADVDFEFLVTEQCGVRGLIQRLGRLNRLGSFEESQAVYLHFPAPTSRGSDITGWPVYNEEPQTVLGRLQCVEGFEAGIDVSPRRVNDVLGEPHDDPGRAPEVMPALLWEWVKTTTPPAGEAPVEPFFSGISDPDRSVSLIWRCHVPAEGQRLWPRPRNSEALEVPIRELREVLSDDPHVLRLRSDGLTLEQVTPSRLRPGDTVVLPTDRGLLDEFGWSPESTNAATDLSLLGHGLPLDARALRLFCGAGVDAEVSRALQRDREEPDEVEQEAAIADLKESLGRHVPASADESQWHDFLASLDRRPIAVDGEVSRLALTGTGRLIRRYDEFDEASLVASGLPPEAVELDRHGEAVGIAARLIASALGVDPLLAEFAGLAGDLHDLGKADDRFQRWLNDSESTVPSSVRLAKSTVRRGRWPAARSASGWPRGGRHEELSARLVRAWLDKNNETSTSREPDLLLHLVVSHHGRGRPLVLPVDDGTAATVEYRIGGTLVSASADLALVDWDQPDRFSRLNDRMGPWGLALLEAIVRQADHLVSAGVVGGDWELH